MKTAVQMHKEAMQRQQKEAMVKLACANIVSAVFGAGYLSQASVDVYGAAYDILNLMPDDQFARVSEVLVMAIKSAMAEAAEVGI